MVRNSPLLGANVDADGTRFGVWAPQSTRVNVRVEDGPSIQLHADECGIHTGRALAVGAGARYRFELDGKVALPDPRSRFQPDGVHGPSEVIDPSAFDWTDDRWSGITIDRLMTYELHVGTFTPEGTFAALTTCLPDIARLGVTAIELMPVADFPGRWNWGYDGVSLFAPSRAYGRPDDLRRLVDRAHSLGLAVILDVVYNHLGPDGNYLPQFSADYFTPRHTTPWGNAVNYDGDNNRFVRDFIIDNGSQWITDFHFDGLRLDATDTIADESDVHILAEFQESVRSATDRDIVLIAEEARNSVRTIHPVNQGGFGFDAVWADDFHHALHVHLTGTREHYYADYSGSTREIAAAIYEGFVYQGQVSSLTGKPRGTQVTNESATGFMFCIQNHDQIGNRPFGDRIHDDISMARYAAATTLLLFLPQPPLLFMGQEFAASTPFLYFTDHEPELGKKVTEGRRSEFSGFRAFSDPELLQSIPDPQDPATFRRSGLVWAERGINRGIYALYRELLALRRMDPVLRLPDREDTQAIALGAQTLAVRRGCDRDTRLLIVNFGSATCVPLSQALNVDARTGSDPRLLLSSSEERFGGIGYAPEIVGPADDRRVQVPARAALIFALSEHLPSPSVQ